MSFSKNKFWNRLLKRSLREFFSFSIGLEDIFSLAVFIEHNIFFIIPNYIQYMLSAKAPHKK